MFYVFYGVFRKLILIEKCWWHTDDFTLVSTSLWIKASAEYQCRKDSDALTLFNCLIIHISLSHSFSLSVSLYLLMSLSGSLWSVSHQRAAFISQKQGQNHVSVEMIWDVDSDRNWRACGLIHHVNVQTLSVKMHSGATDTNQRNMNWWLE